MALLGILELSRLPYPHSWPLLFYAALVSWLLYLVALAVHRLLLSPLAAFPGPKLAALTSWYEAYYDLYKGGQFVFEIRRMHEKYGPIVRVNPLELHVDDPAFYEVVYANKPVDKLAHLQYRFGMELAAVSTPGAELHRLRRKAIAQFFSRAKMMDHSTYIQSVADRVSHRLSAEFVGTGQVVSLNSMWGAMASDVIMEALFARPKHFLDAPAFESSYVRALGSMMLASHPLAHFSFLPAAMRLLPAWFFKRAAPGLAPVLELQEELAVQVGDVLAGRNDEAKSASHRTLFDEMISSNLPPEELRPARLHHEAISVVAGGIETLQRSLSVTCYHVLANLEVEKRLRAELRAAIPHAQRMPSWADLEKLPYLSAVISEGLRLSLGVSQRLARIDRAHPLIYRNHVIPAGTAVGMDAYHMHNNEALYPVPQAFRPERWLDDPRVSAETLREAGYFVPGSGNGDRPLSSYMVAFARGSRMCVGLNVAYAELFIGLATLFRRHEEIVLVDTARADVDFAVDMVTAQPRLGSKGVRVLFK